MEGLKGSRSVLYWCPILLRMSHRLSVDWHCPIATPGLHNPDAGSSLDPLADQYALERGRLRPTGIILPSFLTVKTIDKQTWSDGIISPLQEANKRENVIHSF